MTTSAIGPEIDTDFQQIDLLIEAEWIIPVEPAGITLTQHAVAINDGRILDLLPTIAARKRYNADKTVSLPDQVLLPGLVNLHTHAAMNLFRGYADDLPLMQWLQEKIWPAESRHVSPEFVRDGTLLACAEMLCGGVTCFNDMYFYPGAVALAAQQTGMRASIGLVVIDFPTSYAHDAMDYLAKGLAIRDEWKSDPLLSFSLAPHAPYTVSDQSFERIGILANQLDLGIHTHLHETAQEISDSLKLCGTRPLERLHRLGLVGPQFLAVHAVHLLEGEIDLLARCGAHIAHCPASNLKLGSGIAPLTQIERRGVNFGIGTDGAASNNRLDLLSELRLASLLAKGASGDATSLGAHGVLKAATLGGARALGLEQQIGSIEIGKYADLCAISMKDWYLKPTFDIAGHVVNVGGREQVTHVWVAGEAKLENGQLISISSQYLVELVEMWQNRLVNR